MDFLRLIIVEMSVPFAFIVAVIVAAIVLSLLIRKSFRQMESESLWKRNYEELSRTQKLIDHRRDLNE